MPNLDRLLGNLPPDQPTPSAPEASAGLDLDELEFQEGRATASPWWVDSEAGTILGPDYIVCQLWDKSERDFINHAANAVFVATIRNNAPALLATARNYERLKTAVEAVVRSSNPMAVLADLHDVYEALTGPSNVDKE